MNPYDIDVDSLPESKRITDPKEILKLRLRSSFMKITFKMENSQIMKLTGLDKSDLSRLRAQNLKRFTIDRMIGILNDLGYSAQIKVVRTSKAS
jgi:hypothetical protein